MAYKIKVIRTRPNLDTLWPEEYTRQIAAQSGVEAPAGIAPSKIDRVGDRFVDNGIELSEDGLTKTYWNITLYEDVANEYKNNILFDPLHKKQELNTLLGLTVDVEIEEI